MPTLNVAQLGQRDSRWASQRLGTVNGTTIGSDGCVITSASMLHTYYGKPVLPNALDDFYTDNKIYQSGNLFPMSSINRWNDKVTLKKMVDCRFVAAPIADIKATIDAGKPCFVWVKNNGVEHCTLAVGYEGDKIKVNDPWRGDQVLIEDRWGKSAEQILYVNFFDGPVPSAPVQPAPVGDNIKRKSGFFEKYWYAFHPMSDNTDLLTEDQILKEIAWLKENVRKGGLLDLVENWIFHKPVDSAKITLEDIKTEVTNQINAGGAALTNFKNKVIDFINKN